MVNFKAECKLKITVKICIKIDILDVYMDEITRNQSKNFCIFKAPLIWFTERESKNRGQMTNTFLNKIFQYVDRYPQPQEK